MHREMTVNGESYVMREFVPLFRVMRWNCPKCSEMNEVTFFYRGEIEVLCRCCGESFTGKACDADL